MMARASRFLLSCVALAALSLVVLPLAGHAQQQMPGSPMGTTGAPGAGAGGGGAYVLKAGDTMTGPLVLDTAELIWSHGGSVGGRIYTSSSSSRPLILLGGGGATGAGALNLRTGTAYVGTHGDRLSTQNVFCVSENVTAVIPTGLVCIDGAGRLYSPSGELEISGAMKVEGAASFGGGVTSKIGFFPDTDGEGTIGTTGNQWASVHAAEVNAARLASALSLEVEADSLDVVAHNINISSYGHELALLEDEARWETTSGAGDIVLNPQGGAGAVRVEGDLEQTGGNYFRASRTITTTAVCTAPLACNAQTAGAMFYCEDRSLSKGSGLCLCTLTNDVGYVWQGLPSDTVSSCP